MIFFQMPVVILVVLLHLLPIAMLLLTRKLPWEKAWDRIALAQIIGSAVYIVLFPFLFVLTFAPWTDLPLYYENIWQVFGIYHAEGMVFFLPLLSAAFLSVFAAIAADFWKNKRPPIEEEDVP